MFSSILLIPLFRTIVNILPEMQADARAGHNIAAVIAALSNTEEI